MAGTPITNSTATSYWPNANTVCQRSGRKVKPGTLVREWTGLMVHPDYLDRRSPQDQVRVHAEELAGSVRPEPASDYFLSEGEVTSSDL